MDPLSVGLAGAGIIANVIGQQKAAKEARAAQNQVNGQIADLTAWRDTNVNRPYLDTNVGKNIITKAFDKFRENAQVAKNTAAVTGASDEAVLAQQDSANQGLADTMSNVAAQGAVRADQIDSQYRSNLANLLAVKLGLTQQQQQSGSNLASSAGAFLQGVGPMLGGVGPMLGGVGKTKPFGDLAGSSVGANSAGQLIS